MTSIDVIKCLAILAFVFVTVDFVAWDRKRGRLGSVAPALNAVWNLICLVPWQKFDAWWLLGGLLAGTFLWAAACLAALLVLLGLLLALLALAGAALLVTASAPLLAYYLARWLVHAGPDADCRDRTPRRFVLSLEGLCLQFRVVELSCPSS